MFREAGTPSPHPSPLPGAGGVAALGAPLAARLGKRKGNVRAASDSLSRRTRVFPSSANSTVAEVGNIRLRLGRGVGGGGSGGSAMYLMARLLLYHRHGQGSVMSVKLRLDQVGMTFRTPNGAFQALAPVTLSISPGRFVFLIR